MNLVNLEPKNNGIEVYLKEFTENEVKKFLKTYLKVSFDLGFLEKILDIQKEKAECTINFSFTDLEISKYILKNIIYGIEDIDNLTERAAHLIKQGMIYRIVQTWKGMGLSVYEICEDIFQLGYGSDAIIISKNYQSFENMLNVEISRNRKGLWERLKEANITTAEGMVLYNYNEITRLKEFKFPINIRSINKPQETKLAINNSEELKRVIDNMMKMYTRVFVYVGEVNYRIICFKGELGIILKKESGYKRIEITDKKLEVLEVVEVIERLKKLCRKVYNVISIEFMYIDIQDGDEFKVVDAGSVFDAEDELNDVGEQIVEYFINRFRPM